MCNLKKKKLSNRHYTRSGKIGKNLRAVHDDRYTEKSLAAI